MPLRYFERDANKDIMAEFLNQGEFESVPTVVFYDGNHNYLYHFIERPKTANVKMAELRSACDDLEAVMADGFWPLPKYREMLFIS